jgi:signal peptidase I
MADSLFFTHPGGELHLSNLGQLELLRGMVEHGRTLRTTVRGFSMSPFIRDNDVLTIVPMNTRAPRVGEVVAFTLPNSGQLAIHRIVARAGTGWLVRGDNCPETDGVVARENIIGRVLRVERQGREVRLGLGAEARLIAWLQRAHLLMRAVRVVGWVRRRWIVRGDQ